MKLKAGVLAVVLVLCSMSVSAGNSIPAMVYDQKEEGLIAELYNKPCKDPRIVQMFQMGLPYYADKLQEADSAFRMRSGDWKKYAGCWVEVTQEHGGADGILLFLEDGDYYLLDKSRFQKGTDV